MSLVRGSEPLHPCYPVYFGTQQARNWVCIIRKFMLTESVLSVGISYKLRTFGWPKKFVRVIRGSVLCESVLTKFYCSYFLDVYERTWCLWTALVPPSLPPFQDRFRRLLNLLNCDVMISIMQLVLSRTTARWSKSWSEAQFEMVIYTVGRKITLLHCYIFAITIANLFILK